jgi:hypothetical protein
MRRPRVTIGRLMVAVAIAAVVFGLFVTMAKYEQIIAAMFIGLYDSALVVPFALAFYCLALSLRYRDPPEPE